MTGLVIVSGSCPDINLKKYLGIYEFCVVPDHSLLYMQDEAIIVSELRGLQQSGNEMKSAETESGNAPRKVIAIDTIAFVNMIDVKKYQVQNYSDFIKCFVS